MKEMVDKISNNDDNLYRLLYHLFVYNQNTYLIDYIICVLNITTEKLAEIIEHKYPTPPDGKYISGRIDYDRMSIVTGIARYGTAHIMQYLKGIIGEDLLGKYIFVKDASGYKVINLAVKIKKLKMIKCILSIKSVKEKLLTDDTELGPALKMLNEKFDESVAKYLVDRLELTETKLYELSEVYSLNVKQILSVNV